MLFKSYSEFVKHHSDKGCKRVQDVYDVSVGDRVACWDLDTGNFKSGKVITILYLSKILEVLFIGRNNFSSVDPKDYTIFKLT